MNKIKIEDLKAGTRFSEAVYIEEDSLFVPAEVTIKAKDIDRLKKWGIDEVTTEGHRINDDFLQKGDSGVLHDILSGSADTGVLKIYTFAVSRLETIFNAIKNGEDSIEKEDIDAIVNKVLPAIHEKKEEMLSFIILSGQNEASLPVSSVNCMILSIIIGIEIKLPDPKLFNLSVAALLHDIGMMKIPDVIKKKKGNLEEQERKLLNTHPLYSYKIITESLKYSNEIGKIASQHHERWDGQGYPRKVAGKDIHLYSRIITVADAFEAMISKRPYRNSMIGYHAMRQLLNDNSRRFDSNVLKVFIKTMGIYPIGSIVLLNDASIGRVTGVHPDAPLRPKLRIVVDKDGNKVAGKGPEIDLLQVKNLFIAKAINPEDLESEEL